MSKEKKTKASDADKPLEERNYWKLTKSEKTLWLSKKGLTKSQDVVIPIATPLIGVAVIILGIVLLIFTLNSSSDSIFGKNKPLMAAACGIVAAIGLGVAIWRIIAMKKEKKGFFINQYYSGDKSGIERMHKEIDEETATQEQSLSDDSLASDLEL